MSRNIYPLEQSHPAGCMCDPCRGHMQPMMPAMQRPNAYQEPMRTLTVGDAPVHIARDGVIVTVMPADKYGREVCEYSVDPDYAADLTSQKICDAFSEMDAASLLKIMGLLAPSIAPALAADTPACAALVTGIISSDPANTIRPGNDGKLFENDAVI